MNITVFCSSQPKPGDPNYAQAMRLGQLIAASGHTVLTGGYIGSMEAVSRGAAEAGGHVVGITCDEIECWRPVKANPWVQEERRFATIRQRLFTLIESCDAALALPGGVGTLAEVTVMWNHMQTEALSPRPLVLIGPGWQEVMGTLWRVFDPHIPLQHRSLLTFAQDIEEAISFINHR
jgi:uncharacterized protein (TIGR00730 family)